MNIIFTISIKCLLQDEKYLFFEYFVNLMILFVGGDILKTINYLNPKVARLFIGGISL